MLTKEQIKELKGSASEQEIKEAIDTLTQDFKETIQDIKDLVGDIDDLMFDCPITGKQIPNTDILDHVENVTKREIYDMFGIGDQDKRDAYDRAMGVI